MAVNKNIRILLVRFFYNLFQIYTLHKPTASNL